MLCYYGNVGKRADFSIRPISEGLLKVCLNKVLLCRLKGMGGGTWRLGQPTRGETHAPEWAPCARLHPGKL